MTYVPRLAQSNYSWLGEGSVVYSTGNRPNTPFADNPALQQLQKPYKDAQVQRRAFQTADKVARQTSRQGHVTVYDAVKRQYVSATPEEASFIREVNKDVASQRRASQARTLGTGNVTVYDAVKRQYVSATPEEASFIRNANKEVASQRRASQQAKNIYYGGKTVKSGGQYISITPEQVRAQAQRVQQLPKALGTGHVTVFDASKGLHVSATPEQARLIEAANRSLATPNLPAVIKNPQYNISEILNGGNKFNLNNPLTFSGSTTGAVLGTGASAGATGAGAVAGTPNLPAVIEKRPTELSVVSQTVTEETKKPGLCSKVKGLFGKAKNVLKTGLSKFKAFAKTPKGKWGLAIAAVALVGTALFGYIADRFSAKNRPTPTNGPDKLTMPKYENKVEESDDAEETDETKKSDKTDKTDKKESTGPSKVVMPIADADDDDEEIDDVDDVDADKSKVSDDDDEDVDDVDEVEKPDKAEATDEDDDEDVDEVDESKKTDKTKVADENDDEDVDESDQTKKADDVKKSDDTKKADDTEKKDEEDIDDEE